MGILNATGRERTTTKEQFISTMPLRADIQVHKQVHKGRRGNWYSVILIMESLLVFMRKLKDLPTAPCDRIEAAQSRGAATVHWSRLVLWLPQWSNYCLSCYHILSTTNVSGRMQGLIFSPLPLHPCVANPSPSQREEHASNWFLPGLHIYTHTHAIRSTFIDGLSTTGSPAVRPTPINLPVLRLPAGKTDEPHTKMDW